MIAKEQIIQLETANKIIQEFVKEAWTLIKLYNSLAKETRKSLVERVFDSRNQLTNTSFVTQMYKSNKGEFEIRRKSIEKMISIYDIDSELEFNSLKFESCKEKEEGTVFEFSYWEERTIYSCGEMDWTEIEQIFLYIPIEWFNSNKAEDLIKEFVQKKEEEKWNEILLEEQKWLEEKKKRDKSNDNFEKKRKEVLSSEEYKDYLKLKKYFEEFEYVTF